MADRQQKHPDNVPGAFYVDQNCISCGLCWITARGIILADRNRRAFVARQPETEAEKAAVYEALSDCPEQAIGDDGLRP